MKFLIPLFLVLASIGCQVFEPKLPPEKIKSETEKVIETIQAKPDWLKNEDVCSVEIVPKIGKSINYLDEGCENNPQKCLESCRNEDGNACYSLAILIQRRIDIEREESTPLFWRACKFGIISGCTNFAAAKFNPESSDSKTLKCSIDTFEKTCEKDDAWGCTMFGMVLSEGIGRPRNLDEAQKVLSKSCKYGEESEACRNAKQMLKMIEDSKKSKQK